MIDRRPLRPCECGVVLGHGTCPLCQKRHVWYHMTVQTGAAANTGFPAEDHYLSCDKYVRAESTTWTLAADRSHKVEVAPEEQ